MLTDWRAQPPITGAMVIQAAEAMNVENRLICTCSTLSRARRKMKTFLGGRCNWFRQIVVGRLLLRQNVSKSGNHIDPLRPIAQPTDRQVAASLQQFSTQENERRKGGGGGIGSIAEIDDDRLG